MVKNKTQLKKELSLKNVWNKTKDIDGFKIAGVIWHENKWKIIDKGASFDDVKCIEDQSKVIKSFYYQEELVDYLISEGILIK
jgi:hypothetical protein